MASTAHPPSAASDDQSVQLDLTEPDEAASADLSQRRDDTGPDQESMGPGERALRQLRDAGVI